MKIIFRKKNGAGRINLSDFRLHYKPTVIHTKMVLAQKQKYRPMEQDKNPEINSCICGHLIFEIRGKNIQ